MKQTILSLILALVPVALIAQENSTQQYTPDGHPILTLQQCIKMAVECNSNFLRSQADSTSAEIQLASAKNSFLPQLNAQMGQSFSFGRAKDERGVIINHSAANTDFGVGFSYTLFSGLRRLYNMNEAKSSLLASEQTLLETKDKISLDIIGMYYQVLMQEDMLRISEFNLAQTEFHLNYTKAMVEGGKWALSKQLELESQLANEKLTLIDSRNDLFLTRLNLALNVDYGSPDSLAIVNPDIDKMVALAYSKLYPVKTVYDYAMNNRAGIKAAENNLQTAKLGIRAASSGFIPTLSFNAGYSTSYFYPFEKSQQQFISDFPTQLKHNGRYFLGFTLSIPLFDAMETPNAIRQAKVKYTLAEIHSKDVREALYRQVVTAQANATSASKKIAAATESAKIAKESLKMTEAAFEAGRATPLELEQARNRSLIAEMQLVRAKYDFVYKVAILEHYMGVTDIQ